MKKTALLFLLSMVYFSSHGQSGNTDEIQLRKIYDESLSTDICYNNLKDLCLNIGARLSGTKAAEKAVVWAKNRLTAMNVDTVYLQEVMVPHWERGAKEVLEIKLTAGKSIPLNPTALGGSVGTGKALTAEVIEVQDLAQLEKLGLEVTKGKFVFFNKPMDPKHINTFDAYSGCVDLRISGPSEAAKYGAVGIILRSLSVGINEFAHTGILRYKDNLPKIPAVAISTKEAELLSKQLTKDTKLKVSMNLQCQILPEVLSHNVIGEIKGSLHPEEIIVAGAHLDSWDLGQGAHDDGAGCVQAMEVLRIFKTLNIKPERTIRCVLFMSEENGASGAVKYAQLAKEKNEKHLVAIESDEGGFTPRGFEVDGNEGIKEACLNKMTSWMPLFKPYNVHYFQYGFSGVDVNKLKDQNVALIGFVPDSQRYFDFHHAATDKIDGVNQRELHLGAASITSLVYLFSKFGM